MFDYLLKQLDPNLVWVGYAAHGSAWRGYDPDNMNSAFGIKQTLRLSWVRPDHTGFCIELWQRNRMSEYTLEHEDWDTVVWLINQLIKKVKGGEN